MAMLSSRLPLGVIDLYHVFDERGGFRSYSITGGQRVPFQCLVADIPTSLRRGRPIMGTKRIMILYIVNLTTMA